MDFLRSCRWPRPACGRPCDAHKVHNSVGRRERPLQKESAKRTLARMEPTSAASIVHVPWYGALLQHAIQVHRLISFPSVQATQGVRGCVRAERNKGCPTPKKASGSGRTLNPHVMSGPVQKSQYPSQERAVIGGAAPQKSLILTENGPFPQNFGACGGLGAGAPRRRHTVTGLRPDGRNKGCPTPQERPRKLISRWTCKLMRQAATRDMIAPASWWRRREVGRRARPPQ